MTENLSLSLNPTLGEQGQFLFRRLACALATVKREGNLSDWIATVNKIRSQVLRDTAAQLTYPESARTAICCSVLCDLVTQEWRLTVDDSTISIARPQLGALDADAEKKRIRSGLLVEREEELGLKSVREFVASMETRKLFKGQWVSVFDLMRDGRELSSRIRSIRSQSLEDHSGNPLRNVIEPYLQFVQADTRCEFTGMRLMDIWRYFRYTWSSVYKSTPGRTIPIIVRDAAGPNHPVIGIAALSSAVVQQTVRDRWIGWTAEDYLLLLQEASPKSETAWLMDTLNGLIRDVYKKDFLADGLIFGKDLTSPSQETVDRLLRFSEAEKRKHFKFPKADEHKIVSADLMRTKAFWEKRAKSHLFAAKRAKLLARLLDARRVLKQRGFVAFAKGERDVLKHAEVRQAIGTIIREVKARHVGIDVMAINVCGAVAPYSHLLGGKLVAMMMASPEVVAECHKRYKSAVSIIASAVHGKPVIRAPRLVLMETTSLYGISSSQYNRLKIPLAELIPGQPGVMTFEEFNERTEGYGSFHFSRWTVRALDAFQAQQEGGRKVNSIFGEGVSPRLRKIRDGLSMLGLPAEQLLKHGSKRIVYSLVLAQNFRQVLMGRSNRPRYLVPQAYAKVTTRKIADYWVKRWLSMRIKDDAILSRVEEESLIHPIKHGARVQMPPCEYSGQGDLFEA